MTATLRPVAAVIALVAVVGGGAIWFAGLTTNPSPPESTSSPIPSLAPPPTSAPTAVASPTAVADAVRGWPGNRSISAPGLYSWDEVNCEPNNCVMGVLHRHDDVKNNDVRIVIERIAEWSAGADATPVMVAGHTGFYQRVDAEQEVWNVVFDGRLVSISLTIGSATSKEVADEAHSIIDSLAYEPRDTPLGFRLVFRLTSWLWDSPL